MDLNYDKVDQTVLPISNTRVVASEYNQIAGSLMSIISASGLTPDSADNTQLLNALKAMGSGWAMPSDVYEDLTLGASGSEYTAPTDGYFYIDKVAGIADGRAGFYRNGFLSTNIFVPNAVDAIRTFIPVKKGDKVLMTYTATGTTNAFRFIYAEGSKTEAN